MDPPPPKPEPATARRGREEVAQAALETVAEGGPLAGVLQFLCRTMEEESPDRVVACIHPVNEDAIDISRYGGAEPRAGAIPIGHRRIASSHRWSGRVATRWATRQAVIVPDVDA